MNAAGSGLALALSLAVVTALVACLTPPRARPAVAGLGTALAGSAAVFCGVSALAGHSWSASLPNLLPLTGVQLAVDPLSGLFLALIGAVAICASFIGIGYCNGDAVLSARLPQATFPLFVASLLLVPAAGGVGTLLVAWELMALTSLVLVVTEHRQRPEVAAAGRWYAVMTHLSLVALLLGLSGFAAAAGDDSFATLRAMHLPPAGAGAVFLAALVGFGTKAGVVPLHVWLPRAHPEAPAHVSAVMSGAMVATGIYGIVRVGLDLLGGGPAWWWLLVVSLGSISALHGALQAGVATDLKRLLACSTTENMGLVLIGVGAAGFLRAQGAGPAAGVALTAALLHVIAHAAFKTVLFGAAGSVVHATGTRDLDDLGGLAERMPITATCFAVGALGACALPLGAGFPGEWLLVQSLLHALPVGGTTTAIVVPVAVGVIALTTGLSVAAFVKAYGVGFLGRARTAPAGSAHEARPVLLAGLGMAAAACLVAALCPGLIAGHLTRSLTAAGVTGGPSVQDDVGLRLRAVSGSSSPLLMAVVVVAATGLVTGLTHLAPGARVRRRARLWDCGAGPATVRMQYTATAFAGPLQRVFEDVLRPEANLELTPHAESAYYLRRVAYRQRVVDGVEQRLYLPLLAGAARLGQASRRLADGRVHRYLSYGFVGFIAVLIGLAVTR